MMQLVCTAGQREARSRENTAKGSFFCQHSSEFCLSASVQLEKPPVGNSAQHFHMYLTIVQMLKI